MRCKTIDITYG